MNPEFESCLKKNKIREFSQGKSLVEKELNTALKDFNEAKESLERGKFKWAGEMVNMTKEFLEVAKNILKK